MARFDGTPSNDVLIGSNGNDALYGYAGADTLNGLAGADTMVGGSGDDYYYSDSSLDIVTELANEGTDTLRVTYNATLFANIENLVILPGDLDLTGMGNSLNNLLIGNDGSNILLGADGNDTIDAGDGQDDLIGGSGNDSLMGGDGNDQLIGGDGTNTLIGGAGDDYYVGTLASKDLMIEQAGGGQDKVLTFVSMTLAANVEQMDLADSKTALKANGNTQDNIINGNAYANTILGLGGNDSLAGGSGKDTLDGGDGADTLSGGEGIDKVSGGKGDDVYFVSDKDTLAEVAKGGTDTVFSTISWTLANDFENLIMQGGDPITGTGNTLNNKITGNTGNNKISGSTGNDTLAGGGGVDTITGGGGLDVFTLDADGVSVVTDFSARDDTFQLSSAEFGAFTGATGAISASRFKSSSTGVAVDADDYICYATQTGQIFYDADGNGADAAVLIASVTPKLVLTAADFVLF